MNDLEDCPNGTWKWMYINCDVPAKVSILDYHYLSGFNFSLDGKGYLLCSNGSERLIYLHVIVARRMGLDISFETDHIDEDKLNNLRSNLRTASNSQNGANRGLNKNNTSGLKGAHYDKSRNKWVAQIKVNYRHEFLGRFDTKEEAHTAYCKAAKNYFGEFANFGQ